MNCLHIKRIWEENSIKLLVYIIKYILIHTIFIINLNFLINYFPKRYTEIKLAYYIIGKIKSVIIKETQCNAER